MVELAQQIVDEIVAHAQAEDPNECCGILLGESGRVVALRRVTNAEHSPYRYFMDPQEFYQVYREAERNGWDLWGFYHSHTHTPAYPSQTDRTLASWPDSYYLIVSLENKARPILRAFRLLNGDVQEHEVRVTPS